jgi:hypothetical protein
VTSMSVKTGQLLVARMSLQPLRYATKALSEALSSLGLTVAQRAIRLARSSAVYHKIQRRRCDSAADLETAVPSHNKLWITISPR